MRGLLLVWSLLFVVAGGALAQEPAAEPNLDDFLKAELAIASRLGTTAREAPGVVTLITDEEIEQSGARDLIDLLRLVPGFDFGVDVQGVVGAGIRGNWGHEGKILLLVDGIEMNEPLFSTVQFGNHFPLGHIKRIEIIRGPGSVIYGGYAELAVINIITKTASDLQNGFASIVDGEMSGTYGRRSLEFGIGHTRSALSFSLLGSVAKGNRSDQTYTDLEGSSYDMAGNSRLDNQQLNLSVGLKQWSLRLLLDRYLITQRDEFGVNLAEATDVDFVSWFLDTSYVWVASPSTIVTPRLSYKRQTPWRENSESLFYDKTIERYGGGVSAVYEQPARVSLLGGLEAFVDRATAGSDTPVEDYFPNGRRTIEYETVAFYSQAAVPTSAGTFTAGARYERHSQFGSSFVPRLSFTTLRGPFHLKALASRAFRAPSVENIRLGTDIKPEKTTVFELEAGYQLSAESILTANLFQTTIRGPVVYFVDPETAEEGYRNFERTGSRGLEVEYRYRPQWGYLTTAYSHYQARANEVESYDTPTDRSYLLGFPRDKVSMSASIKTGATIRVNPTVTYFGKRYGYTTADASGTARLESFSPVTLLNIFVTKSGFLRPELSLGAGVFDLLGENYQFIQPYNSGHPPLPDASREFVVRLTYRPR